MIDHDSDEDFDQLIHASILQADETIKHLRHQYEQSLQRQHELEKQVQCLSCHKCSEKINCSKQVQCTDPIFKVSDASCQTEKYMGPDTEDRFFQRVDQIVDQNKELHSNIYNLQMQLEKLDASRKTMRSDFNLKHSEAIERMKILEAKREKSFQGRIQMLEEERTNSLCSLGTMSSSVDSGSFSESKPHDRRSNNISHLADIEKEDLIVKNGEDILKKIEVSVRNLEAKSTASTPNNNELNKMRFEKDTALKKCVKLDSQLSAVKKSKDLMQNKVSQLEDELQSLRLFYNLHQSLSQEASLKDQYDTQVSDLTERLKQREAEMLASQHENDALAAMVKRLERQLSQVGSIPNGISTRHFNASPSIKSTRTGNRMSSSSTISSLM
ncbi:hypothetical protein ACHWQZ_G014521 [Mnemiopsis leidyi]